MTASLAYRKNEAAIHRGDVPEKYTRLLPHIAGERVLEIGCAEGVLALLLAREGKRVIGLDQNADRLSSAALLRERWTREGTIDQAAASRCNFVQGSIADHFDLLDGIDTVVACRVIYYFRGLLDQVFAEIAARVPHVVLCGNRNRADAFHAGRPHEPLGKFNYYASIEGMRDVILHHGYRIVGEVSEGDAIVVGRRG